MFLSLFNQDLVGLWLHGHSSLLLGGGETGGAWNRFFGRCHPEELQNLRTHQSLGRCGLPVKTLNIGPDMTYIWYPFEGLLCGVVVSTWLLHGIGHTDGSNFKDNCHGQFVQSLCLFPHFNFWTPRMRISSISFNHLKKVFASKVMFKPWKLVESQLQTFWHIFGCFGDLIYLFFFKPRTTLAYQGMAEENIVVIRSRTDVLTSIGSVCDVGAMSSEDFEAAQALKLGKHGGLSTCRACCH